MTIFIMGICRTQFFVGLRIGLDAPDVSAPQRPWLAFSRREISLEISSSLNYGNYENPHEYFS